MWISRIKWVYWCNTLKLIMMNKILKYFLVFFTYNLLGLILWYRQDLLMPIFVTFFILINMFLMDESKKFIRNFIEISGLMTLGFGLSLILKDTDKPLAFGYLGIMVVASLLIFYLKKRKVNLLSTE